MKPLQVRFVTNLDNILGIIALKLYPNPSKQYYWSESYEGEKIECQGKTLFPSTNEAESAFFKEFTGRLHG